MERSYVDQTSRVPRRSMTLLAFASAGKRSYTSKNRARNTTGIPKRIHGADFSSMARRMRWAPRMQSMPQRDLQESMTLTAKCKRRLLCRAHSIVTATECSCTTVSPNLCINISRLCRMCEKYSSTRDMPPHTPMKTPHYSNPPSSTGT